MWKEERGGGVSERRRSARICALEESSKCNKQKKSPQSHHHNATMHDSGSGQPLPQPQPQRKRGRKKKRLEEVVVSSVATTIAQDGENPKHEDLPINADQPEILPSLSRMPEKRILEFILDLLQRKDTHEIFAEPVDTKEVEGYYEIIKEPMDFGTLRAKLQEGMYTTLEQFEHDVFLISSNAMHFNSSTTIYFRQARAIHELAQRVFNALKTDPGNFELEFSLTRGRPGRKPHGENGGSRTKLASNLKPGGMKIGVSPNSKPCSLNGPSSLRRNIQGYLASSSSNAHVDRRENENIRGSSDCRNLNFVETEKRQSYRPWTSFLGKNESIVSAVYSGSKPLMHINHGGIGYRESMMRFVKDLGPTAQMVANRRLRCLIETPNCQSVTPTHSIQAPNHLHPATPAQHGPAHLDGVINGQMPHDFLRNLPGNLNVIKDANDQLDIPFKGENVCTSDSMNIHGGAYRGHMACASGRMDIQSAFLGETVITNDVMRIHGGSQGERARTTYRKDAESGLQGQMGANTCGMMGICGPFRGEMIHTTDKVDLHREAVTEDIVHQYQNTQVQLGSYFPITAGIEGLNCPPAGITNTGSKYATMDMMVDSSLLINHVHPAQLALEPHSRLLGFRPTSNNCLESSLLPLQQAFNVSGLSQATTSLHGLGSHYVGGEEQIYTPLGPNYGASSAEAGQPLEWSFPTPWGPQAIYDLPGTQLRLPEFDEASLYDERAPPQSHQAEASTQCFWDDVQQQSLMNIQQPDLALQL